MLLGDIKEEDKYVVYVDGIKRLLDTREAEYMMIQDYPEQSVIEMINKLLYKFRGNVLDRILFIDRGLVDINPEKKEDEEDTNKDN
jgi:hypothetical protein